jgi:hypothetical protein
MFYVQFISTYVKMNKILYNRDEKLFCIFFSLKFILCIDLWFVTKKKYEQDDKKRRKTRNIYMRFHIKREMYSIFMQI